MFELATQWSEAQHATAGLRRPPTRMLEKNFLIYHLAVFQQYKLMHEYFYTPVFSGLSVFSSLSEISKYLYYSTDNNCVNMEEDIVACYFWIRHLQVIDTTRRTYWR